MLNAKMLCIFRTRGVRDFVLWRDVPDQIIPGYLHVYYMPVKKCGGLMMTGDMYSYLISALFSCRLA